MRQGNRGLRALFALGGAAILVATAAGCGTQSGGDDKEVSVIGTWADAEQEAFLAMVAPWEQKTGNKVKYTGTRDLNAVLTTGVASGILPDLAGLPGPGQLVEFAKGGALKELDSILDMNAYKAETSQAVASIGNVDGKTYGVFIKTAVKGLIWFNPDVYSGGTPADFAATADVDLGDADSLWCVGLESEAASGWPGTDWIEDILIRESGPEVYDAWVAGTQKWTSPEVKAAFELFGDVLDDAYGDPEALVSDGAGDFRNAGNPLFTDPPGCLFHHQANFITTMFKENGGAQDGQFDFFVMPDINPDFAGSLTGAGDLFGLFSDKAAAKDLIKYLVTAEAQQIWVDRGGAISANNKVTTYPDDVSKRSADALLAASAFRFDGSDLMPKAMNDAFWAAMLDFTVDQSKLDSILSNLDEIQTSAYGG
jgi:alpha-glucoside transport system substrate-binding protein